MTSDSDDGRRCAHLVLFRLHPRLSPADRAGLAEMLTTACRTIPAVRRCRVGRRITHGVPYEQEMAEDYQYVLILEFDDVNGLRSYLQHSAHDPLGTAFRQAREAALVYDYALRDVDDIAALLDET